LGKKKFQGGGTVCCGTKSIQKDNKDESHDFPVMQRGHSKFDAGKMENVDHKEDFRGRRRPRGTKKGKIIKKEGQTRRVSGEQALVHSKEEKRKRAGTEIGG